MPHRPALEQGRLARLVALGSLVGLALLPACAVVGEGPGDDDVADEETGSTESPLVTTVGFQNGASGYGGTTDATLTQATPTTNAGGAAVLRADVDYPNGSGKVANAVLRFDLASLAKGSKVESVTLGLHVLNATSGQGYTLYALARGFSEAQVTWNAAASGAAWSAGGARGGADRASEPLGTLTPTAAGAHTVTLNAAGRAAVQRWIDDPATNHGFVLDATTNMDGLELASSEAATASQRPKLSVKIATPDVPPPTGAFVHPGIGVGRGQLDFVKAKIAAGAQPWAGELERARNSRVGKVTWVARPVAVMRCGNGPSDVDEGCTTSRDDATAAYTLALLGFHTGDARYSAAAAAILDAWATTLKEIVFVYGNYDTHNGPLQAAWLAESFPRAAEILRYTYAGWPAANAARFGTMLRTAILPRIVDGWNDGGHNWSTSMANGTMNLGVYLDDRAIFDKGVAAWRLRTPQNFHLKSDGPKPLVPREYAQADGTWKPASLASAWYGQTEFGTDRTNGITKETCRDFGHVEMTLASVAYGAETGLLQGLDLYGEMRERIVRAYEFVAKWHNLSPANLGKARDYATPSWLCPAQGHVQLQELPTWEVGYNHLAGRLGIAMPETRALVDRYRASNAGRYTNLQIQWETLTHGGIAWGGLR